MSVLTDDMKRVVRQQRLAFVATVCPDNTPNVSPKGCIAVRRNNHPTGKARVASMRTALASCRSPAARGPRLCRARKGFCDRPR